MCDRGTQSPYDISNVPLGQSWDKRSICGRSTAEQNQTVKSDKIEGHAILYPREVLYMYTTERRNVLVFTSLTAKDFLARGALQARIIALAQDEINLSLFLRMIWIMERCEHNQRE